MMEVIPLCHVTRSMVNREGNFGMVKRVIRDLLKTAHRNGILRVKHSLTHTHTHTLTHTQAVIHEAH